MNKQQLNRFVMESNAIEGINRTPLPDEIRAHEDFLELDSITVEDLSVFVDRVQPNERLRLNGECVTVGYHIPPKGGMNIYYDLCMILHNVNSGKGLSLAAFDQHRRYETLHPFTDGNGRSGRAIWLWMMNGKAPLGFLHTWYYQSLSFSR